MRALRSLSLSVLVVVALAASGCSSKSDTPAGITGDWHGSIEIPDQPLAVGVSFTDGGRATIDIPAQGVSGKELGGVRNDPGQVEWTIPGIPGDPSFKGSFDKGADTIKGQFSQSGTQFPLNLTRGKVEAPARPQEPKPPWPYRSEDVSYRSGDITIAGTLTEPRSAGPHPAVVLITGSGAQDRNEEIAGHKPFLLIADTLTRAGYAVLRTDDRGVGGTGGKRDEASYQDLAGDVAAGVAFLHGRSEIDGKRIGLLGHSEGGYLAPLVAAEPDSGVAFAILMAGPAVRGSEVLIEQNRLIMTTSGATPEQVAAQVGYITKLTEVMGGGDLAAARKFAHEHNDSLPADQRASAEVIDRSVTTSMLALANYDPAPALSALRIPVLAVYGGKDVQVLAIQNEGPARTLLAADPDATVHVFDGLDHLMQPANSGLPGEYSTIETTIDPQVLDYYTAWLTQRFPANR
ncbi:alpha/beta fold hydrolase [Nocardia sp. SYP-A9097]|uniref:alpha/beta hydrolase family protein n=1 Tax=Nocardia sp. SYP-A9097 TaxID=2663237 RepID=UPI00129B9B90|nr:alpha/beta fold hydrolase [Nocardia sp. SYP-A9097]MRH90045.1 alpha/beta fold hydrolase [Nocardia sp. SYP-A9097]